ncbi:MAG: peptidyl-prolyl cis-trans isomerase [Candidatus Eisenbacteria bacterium]|nr:peptidyl-prolyl cis-trans isomerase [Candidatus Eisenbacteria bacterium]
MKRVLATLLVLGLALPAAGQASSVRKLHPKGGAQASGKAAAKTVRPRLGGPWAYPPGNSPLLADVDGRPVTRSMLEQAFQRLDMSAQAPSDDTTGARQLLGNLIDKAYLGWVVTDLGFELNTAERQEYQKRRQRTMADYLGALQQEAAAEVTDEDARALWEKQRTVYACHRLGVRRKATADSVVAQLRAGAVFESLAARNNEDPLTQSTLGQVTTYWTVGFMPDWLEPAVVALKAGQVSEPVRGPGEGLFYVVRLDSLETRDPGPFEMSRDRLRGALAGNRAAAARSSMMRQFMERLQPEFNDAVLAMLVVKFDSAYRAIPVDTTSDVPTQTISNPVPRLTEAQKDLTLLESSVGSFRIRDMVTPLERVASFMRPRMATEEDIRRFAMTMAAQPIIYDAAVKAKLDTLPLVARDLFDTREKLLLERFIRTHVEERAKAPVDTVKAFFQAHLDAFDYPAWVKIYLIQISDSARADSVLKLVELGYDIEKLARELSEDPVTATEGGSMVFYAGTGESRRDTTWEKQVLAMEAGEHTRKPFLWNGSWYIVDVMGKAPRRHRTWEEAEKYARDAVEIPRQERIVQEYLQKARARHPLKLYPEEMAKVELRRRLKLRDM